MDADSLETLVATWITGWSQARSYEPRREGKAILVTRHDGDGITEKILVRPSSDELAEHCASLEGVGQLTVITEDLPGALATAESHGLHRVSGTETLMLTEIQEHDVEAPRPPGDGIEYSLSRPEPDVTAVSVTVNGQPAASGTVTVVDTVAVFDRIVTEEAFRRRGLASFVMRCLTHAAQQEDAEKGLLVASPDGQLLYSHLGWDEVASVPVFTPGGE